MCFILHVFWISQLVASFTFPCFCYSCFHATQPQKRRWRCVAWGFLGKPDVGRAWSRTLWRICYYYFILECPPPLLVFLGVWVVLQRCFFCFVNGRTCFEFGEFRFHYVAFCDCFSNIQAERQCKMEQGTTTVRIIPFFGQSAYIA